MAPSQPDMMIPTEPTLKQSADLLEDRAGNVETFEFGPE